MGEEEIEEEMMIPMPEDQMRETGDLDHLHHPEKMIAETDTMDGTAMTETGTMEEAAMTEIIEEGVVGSLTMNQREKEMEVVMEAFLGVRIVMEDITETIAVKEKPLKKDPNLISLQEVSLWKRRVVMELSQAYLEVLNLLILSNGKKKWKRDFRRKKKRKKRLWRRPRRTNQVLLVYLVLPSLWTL